MSHFCNEKILTENYHFASKSSNGDSNTRWLKILQLSEDSVTPSFVQFFPFSGKALKLFSTTRNTRSQWDLRNSKIVCFEGYARKLDL